MRFKIIIVLSTFFLLTSRRCLFVYFHHWQWALAWCIVVWWVVSSDQPWARQEPCIMWGRGVMGTGQNMMGKTAYFRCPDKKLIVLAFLGRASRTPVTLLEPLRFLQIGLLSLSHPTDSVQLRQWGNWALSSAQAVSVILCIYLPICCLMWNIMCRGCSVC